MTQTKQIKKAIRLEKKEERWLLREYSYLDDLKGYVEKKDKEASERIAMRMGRYEYRLERVHKRVLEGLESLKTDMSEFAKEIEPLEKKINVFRADLVKEISRFVGEINDLIKKEQWDELSNRVIRQLEKDIRGWEILDNKIIAFEQNLLVVAKAENKIEKKAHGWREKVLVALLLAIVALKPLFAEPLKKKAVDEFMKLGTAQKVQMINEELAKTDAALAELELKKSREHIVKDFNKEIETTKGVIDELEDQISEMKKAKEDILRSSLPKNMKKEWVDKYNKVTADNLEELVQLRKVGAFIGEILRLEKEIPDDELFKTHLKNIYRTYRKGQLRQHLVELAKVQRRGTIRKSTPIRTLDWHY